VSARLVVKFGGTSLATASRLVLAARRIAAVRRRGIAVSAVVSARGHTTDRIVADLERTAKGAPHGREWDRALATGEELSAALLAAALEAEGVPARSLRGGEAGVVAEGAFGGGTIARVLTPDVERLLGSGTVPVVAGYQGLRADGETVTLGRGGSDTSAVALAAALHASCDIVTDVPGVFDRDPRRHPGARHLAEVTYADLRKLAESGAQVVHPAAARLAERHRVPLRVYDFRAPFDAPEGTVVLAAEALEAVS
jgi:aspartate kinase